MRATAFIAVALVFAGTAAAQDRYGPESIGNRNPASAQSASMPTGRMLGWPGKADPAVIAAASAPLPNRPLADGLLRNTSAAGSVSPWQPMTMAPQRPTVAPQAQTQTPVENAPWRRLTGQSQAPLESAPPAQPTTPVQAPIPLAAAQPASTTPQGDQARYYSLHRQYGETPDPVAMPEKSQVFLAGGPLSPRLDELDGDESDTGKTAAAKKARLAADWGSGDTSPANERVQIIRP
jgi:hypothetical protein